MILNASSIVLWLGSSMIASWGGGGRIFTPKYIEYVFACLGAYKWKLNPTPRFPGIYSPYRYTNFMQNNMIAYGVGYETIIFIMLKKTGIFAILRYLLKNQVGNGHVNWMQHVRWITKGFVCNGTNCTSTCFVH